MPEVPEGSCLGLKNSILGLFCILILYAFDAPPMFLLERRLLFINSVLLCGL